MIDLKDLISDDERRYWEDELDVPVDEALRKLVSSDDELFGWIDELPPFTLGSICIEVGAEETVEGLANFFKADIRRAVPLALCEAFLKFKRNDVLEEVAKRLLTLEAIDRASRSPSKYERLSLVWEFYKLGLDALKEVELLTLLVRRGGTRYELIHDPAAPANDPAEFFDQDQIQLLLDDVDSTSSAKLRSYCYGTLERDDGKHLVFIRRAFKPAYVADGDKNIWGHDRELMVLQFEPSMREVDIACDTPELPVKFANRIASAFFGRTVQFDLPKEISSKEQVHLFLQNLAARATEFPIVELKIRNTGLPGAPEVTISDRDSKSINQAIQEFSAQTRDAFADPGDVAYLKLSMFGKRVKIRVEQLGARAFVVRYEAAKLRADQRRAFVSLMKEQFGIEIRSTEKRHAA